LLHLGVKSVACGCNLKIVKFGSGFSKLINFVLRVPCRLADPAFTDSRTIGVFVISSYTVQGEACHGSGGLIEQVYCSTEQAGRQQASRQGE